MNDETRNELPLRLITASVVIGVLLLLLGLAFFDPRFRFVLAVVSVTLVALASYELFRIGLGSIRRYVNAVVFAAMSVPSLAVLFYVAGKGLPMTLATGERVSGVALLVWYVAVMLTALVCAISARQDLSEIDGVFRKVLPSLVLVGLGGGALTALTVWPDAPKLLAYLILIVTANDTAAYFLGLKFGAKKSAPLVSPNKTWVGHGAGLIAGTATAVAFLGFLPLPSCPYMAATIGVTLTLSAQGGDLLKSYFKRLHSVKDTGNILPGHGGILDRIDGALAGAPVLLISLIAFSNGI